MPGKYPTIEVLPTTRSAITTGDDTQSASRSDTATLKVMFPRSPIYNVTAAQHRITAQELLLGNPETTQAGDPDQFPFGVDLDYKTSPDLSKGIVGLDSPYHPNLIVNGDPNFDGTGAPAVPINDNFGSGDLVTAVIPASTSAKLATTSIVAEGPVGSGGQSAAHDINPGAMSPTIISPAV
jgi:hypothetical protein